MIATKPRAFHVMTKPVGPKCNLDCTYCFYLEKERLYEGTRNWRMGDQVLESYVRQYIASQEVPEVGFAWQGGEPTLLGVDFFRRVVELQRRYANGKRITNAFQTNGTLLDDGWGEFLARNHFLVGLSVDGPRELHDAYRVTKGGGGSFDQVMRGLDVLKRHGVEFNTLTVVNRKNSYRPLEVYQFLKQIGSQYHQYIPLVEREASVTVRARGMTLMEPPVMGLPQEHAPVTPWSVEAKQYGEFLCTIFDEWVRADVGRTFVQIFDVALATWAKAGPTLCVFAETCGDAMALEHNGDLYACDHYVYPRYKLGNVTERPLAELVGSLQQRRFGADKYATLPQHCLRCEVRFACNGECPKHRFIKTPDGEDGLNYLCAAYKRFFNHVDPHMKTMVRLLSERKPPAMIMDLLRPATSRNEPCRCGSGRKFKHCCGR